MLTLSLGIITRIVSNSYLNVFQKILSNKGEKSSVINFYTYLGLTLLVLPFLKPFVVSSEILINFLIMGFLGAIGNYCIIKALSIGELSTLAPINAYKPVVAMLAGIIYLHEIPSLCAILAIALIIWGTFFILVSPKSKNFKISQKNNNTEAIVYRIMALIFSGTEAILIKKLILITSVTNTLFLWAFSGLIFASLFVIYSKHKPIISSYKHQLLLIISVGIMQYSTNYVFARMNVAYALAFFQLSTLLSVFLGVNIFGEKNFKRKLIGAVIMIFGAIILQQL